MSATSLMAAEVSPGQAKAAACAACHGTDGNATSSQYPRLAGQYDSYMQQALHEYQSGQRHNAIMQAIARGLSNQDIADLAGYYAGLPSHLTITKAYIQGAGE
ncbi:c-type cytochrome [Frateuria aurantia]